MQINGGMIMGNWEKMTDYEAEKIKDYEGRFTVNFKKIYMDVDEISERTTEINEKHPKDSLLKLWAGALVGMFIFIMLSYQILMIVTLPFIILYFVGICRIGKCWKSFNYSAGQFWGMTIGALIPVAAAALVIQQLVIKSMS